MNLNDYKIQRKMLEGSIKLAVEKAVEKFQKTTDHCPHKITVEMIDVTGFVYGQDVVRRRQRRFKVGQVHAHVEI